MSKDVKKMRRRLHKKLAREHRAETRGYGKLRRTVRGWVAFQRVTVALEALKSDTESATRNDAAGGC